MKKLVISAALATLAFAAPAHAGKLELGVLDCVIDGGQSYIIASNKGVTCTFRPYNSRKSELYTGVISKLGVDLGMTHQGQLSWAVLAASSSYDLGSGRQVFRRQRRSERRHRRRPQRFGRRLRQLLRAAAALGTGADRPQCRCRRDFARAAAFAEVKVEREGRRLRPARPLRGSPLGWSRETRPSCGRG